MITRAQVIEHLSDAFDQVKRMVLGADGSKPATIEDVTAAVARFCNTGDDLIDRLELDAESETEIHTGEHGV